MTSPWAQSPEAGVESPGPHPAPDSPGTGWGTCCRDRGRNGGRGGVRRVNSPLSTTTTTTSPPLLWVDSEPHLVEEMWLRLQTLWLLPSKARIFHSHTAKKKKRERWPGHTYTHAHVNTHTQSLFLHSLRIGGGKPYQVIGGKIDDDSIIVQILSHAALAWTSIQNTLPPTPRGSSSVLGSPRWCLHGAQKGCISIPRISVSRFWRVGGTRNPQRDGNSPRKDGADRLRSACSDKNPCSLWVMFGFLATNRGLHSLLHKHSKSGCLRCNRLL